MVRGLCVVGFVSISVLAHAECLPVTDADKEIIRERLELELKDAQSARFKQLCKLPRKLERDTPGFGYCGLVNSKNSYGAYAGYSRFWVGDKGGRVDDHSTVFETFYCSICSDPEMPWKACLARALRQQ
jgi:hypothetical protein